AAFGRFLFPSASRRAAWGRQHLSTNEDTNRLNEKQDKHRSRWDCSGLQKALSRLLPRIPFGLSHVSLSALWSVRSFRCSAMLETVLPMVVQSWLYSVRLTMY